MDQDRATSGRRELLKKAGVAGAVVWAAPTVQTIAAPSAFAAASPGPCCSLTMKNVGPLYTPQGGTSLGRDVTLTLAILCEPSTDVTYVVCYQGQQVGQGTFNPGDNTFFVACQADITTVTVVVSFDDTNGRPATCRTDVEIFCET